MTTTQLNHPEATQAQPTTMTALDPVARRAQQRRRRRLGLFAAGALLLVVLIGIARTPGVFATATDTNWWASAGHEVLDGWRAALLNPWYWGFVAVLVVAERLLPGRDGEGTLNAGGAQDLAWTVLGPLLSLTVVPLAVGALNAAYDHVLGGFSFDLERVLGPIGIGVLAFLVADFLMWFTHWARHKVPTFWHFHAVHHSATRMNPFMDNRVHVMEPVIAATLVLLPARLLGLDGHAALALAIATTFFTAFIHANLRTNLGPLRYVLVTPQAHRVHHSFAPEHIDTNFGTVLSVWDRLFGTYYYGEDEYPTVGIPDTRFPLESEAGLGQVVAGVARQTAYPFRQCIEDIGRFRD